MIEIIILILCLGSSEVLGQSVYYDIPIYYGHFSLNYFQPSQILTSRLTVLEYHFAVDASYDNSTIFFAQETENCIYKYQNFTRKITKLAGNCGLPGNVVGSITNAEFNGVSSVAYFKTPSKSLLDRIQNQTVHIVANGQCLLDDPLCILNAPFPALGMQNIRLNPEVAIYQDEEDQSEFLYVADTKNHCIKRIDLGNLYVEVVAGLCGSPGFLDGPMGYNRLNSPRNLGISRRGVLFFFDSGSQYIRIVKADSTVSTLFLGACKLYRPGRKIFDYELQQILCYQNWIQAETQSQINHYFDPSILNVCTNQFSQCNS